MIIPPVWSEPFSDQYECINALEAARRFRIHQLPQTLEKWKESRETLKKSIAAKMRLDYDRTLPLDCVEHGTPLKLNGYTIKKVSYLGAPGRRVSGNLYIPDGPGPFPAVLNMHGHWTQGRLAARVQMRVQCGYGKRRSDA